MRRANLRPDGKQSYTPLASLMLADNPCCPTCGQTMPSAENDAREGDAA